MLASRLARERGFDEALLVTPHGRVLEAPTSSLFYVDERGELVTPPLEDHILASITRARLLELTDAVERPTTTEELLRAREAFLASTTREVQSVAAIEDRDLGPVGERTRQCADVFRRGPPRRARSGVRAQRSRLARRRGSSGALRGSPPTWWSNHHRMCEAAPEASRTVPRAASRPPRTTVVRITDLPSPCASSPS